ncbi:hypothetical protein YPPY47_1189 [Yersinia pestis PY-47]|uniref:Uncharacterized protein n=1 Tax=Yersinia pestis TaxID=632 RepID=Q8CKL5_YERPE|nr:hypothetical [Yersinia pestis KIM10+]ADV97556.1 hypothetical protein YPC_0867 [Yersinia pestis biovar Medievalis str. Harbin 35]EEO75626.1 hypothetical protein YP516_3557 [Yersinia pestis Nepal516]EEO82952.1 hypothetical protein YPF_0929 [Yersinia pestis biovar Orientalis str. India 195]EEO87265.1 hypothetical protein YPH_3203 [Yersinia pestis biovar Orientalis str. PEXU2]EEO91324.1 hypothetical protein YPS_1551 [Yersinia pestis Pestoides A]EIQ93516.1 hypothetical protein YPPY02_1069 [Yers
MICGFISERQFGIGLQGLWVVNAGYTHGFALSPETKIIPCGDEYRAK